MYYPTGAKRKLWSLPIEICAWRLGQEARGGSYMVIITRVQLSQEAFNARTRGVSAHLNQLVYKEGKSWRGGCASTLDTFHELSFSSMHIEVGIFRNPQTAIRTNQRERHIIMGQATRKKQIFTRFSSQPCGLLDAASVPVIVVWQQASD